MNEIYIMGRLIHKPTSLVTKQCKVERWINLSSYEFNRLLHDPMRECEAVRACKDLMCEEEKGCRCIMLLNEDKGDGILVQADGYDYARYAMFVPNAAAIYEQQTMTQAESDLQTVIRETVHEIADLAHAGCSIISPAGIVDMDKIKDLVSAAVTQRLEQREDILAVISAGDNIEVETKDLDEIKFYCPLKITRIPEEPLFEDDEDEEYSDEPEELDSYEAIQYESEINDGIEAYQSGREKFRGLMAYLGDRRQFCDKVYSIFPSVEKVGDRLMGVYTCQTVAELESYELSALREELVGQSSDGWGEGFEQREIHTDCGKIYVSFWSDDADWEMMTEAELSGGSGQTEGLDMKM